MTLNFRGLGTGYRPVLLSIAVLSLGFLTLTVGGAVPKLPVAGNHHSGPSSQFSPIYASNPGRASTSRKLDLSQLPLRFEPNQGQTDPQVKFLARGTGYGLFLSGDQAVLVLGKHSKNPVIRMKMAGSNPDAVVSGDDQLPGKSNYLHRE